MVTWIRKLLGKEPLLDRARLTPSESREHSSNCSVEQAAVAGSAADFPVPEEWKPLLAEMEQSNGHFFVTGQAGTGKSTLIGLFRQLTGKNVVVVAPTGLAAINAQGITIHSLGQFPPAVITGESVREITEKHLIRAIDTIIVDEVSQVRCDLLDGLDRFMRRNGRDGELPFGGVQVILVGDPCQLPPLVSDGERQTLERAGYPGPFYFWNSNVYGEINPRRRELNRVFRQAEQEFLDLLDGLRTNDVDGGKFDLLRQCIADPEFDPFASPLHTMLTSDNDEARYYNNRQLYRLPGSLREYRAKRTGSALNINSPDYNFPCEETLSLRVGARVICCKTIDQALENGTMGTVVDLEEDAVRIRTDGGESIRVLPSIWELIKYSCNQETGRIEPKVTGTIEQIPLRLAWALTIHTSQGLTLDQVHIDLSAESFPREQTFNALSRCRSFAGIKLKTKFFNLNPGDIVVDEHIADFMHHSRCSG